MLVLWRDDVTVEVDNFLTFNNIRFIVRDPIVKKSPGKIIKPEMKKNLYYGIYEGMKSSKNQGYTHMFRVRTDQYIDFSSYIQQISCGRGGKFVTLGID